MWSSPASLPRLVCNAGVCRSAPESVHPLFRRIPARPLPARTYKTYLLTLFSCKSDFYLRLIVNRGKRSILGCYPLLVIFLLVHKYGLLGFNYGNCPFRDSLDFHSVLPHFRKYRFLFLYAERRRLPHEGRRRRSVRKNMRR